MAFIHAGGTLVKKELNNETLKVDTGCIAAFTSGIDYDIQRAGNLKSMIFGGEGLFLATLREWAPFFCRAFPFREWRIEFCSTRQEPEEAVRERVPSSAESAASSTGITDGRRHRRGDIYSSPSRPADGTGR